MFTSNKHHYLCYHISTNISFFCLPNLGIISLPCAYDSYMRHPNIDDGLRKKLVQDIAKKTAEINEIVTRMMAKQNVTLATIKLPEEEKPGETPLERLKRWFRELLLLQKRSLTEELGLCLECGQPIDVNLLVETPWRARCPRCEEMLMQRGRRM